MIEGGAGPLVGVAAYEPVTSCGAGAAPLLHGLGASADVLSAVGEGDGMTVRDSFSAAV
ncbi:hypothetical protein AB0G86_40300 [Streptomyces scabiei]|uniref:hypothetical protein n=1 Tax=Streptomyces scabiei TaxID=1930 RepID=UPI0033D027C8